MRRNKIVHIRVDEDFYKELENGRRKLERKMKLNNILPNYSQLQYSVYTKILAKNKIKFPKIKFKK